MKTTELLVLSLTLLSVGSISALAGIETKTIGTNTKTEDQTKDSRAQVDRVYFVGAETIAKALDKTIAGVTVKAVDKDRIVIVAKGNDQFGSISEMRRRIALIDLPQPKIGLHIWAFQMSAKGDDRVRNASELLSESIYDVDQQIISSFDRAWEYIHCLFEEDGIRRHDKMENLIFDRALYEYVTSGENCDNEKAYCLEYLVSENAYPSMAKLLLALTFLPNPIDHIEPLLSKMEDWSKDTVESYHECEDCGANKSQQGYNEWRNTLEFSHFKRALNRLYGKNRHRLLQVAVADFLFYYKWSDVHPKMDEFDPRNFSRSADQLTALFSPVFEGFMRDLHEYIEKIEDHPCWQSAKCKLDGDKCKRDGDKRSKKGLQSSGVVQVATLSGTPTTLRAEGVNYYDVYKPLDLATILRNKNTQDEVLSSHLGGIPGQVSSLLAGAMSVEPTIVEVTRGVRLAVTPSALPKGSAAELLVKLEVGEGGTKPKTVSGEGTVKALDRVARHTIDTKVRVEVLRLFEVSTFLNHVTLPVPDKPVRIIGDVWHAMFASVPGLNRLFVTRGRPEEVSHKSLIMVQAVIVPTALDLGWSLEWSPEDRPDEKDKKNNDLGDQRHENGRASKESGKETLYYKQKRFHEYMRRCLALPEEIRGMEEPFKGGCETLTYDIIPDYSPPKHKRDTSSRHVEQDQRVAGHLHK